MKKPDTLPAIAILGGYGNVGTLISTYLAQELDARIIIAGRDGARAAALANNLGKKAESLAIDATQPASYRKLFDPKRAVRVVISCLELDDANTLPKETLEHGIDFTEISAEYASHQRLLGLQAIAKKNKSAAVIGVGLMPGLSNVMANDVVSKVGTAREVNINIMLGLGEAHGADSINWTLRQLGTPYKIHHKDGLEEVVNFKGAHTTTLATERKKRAFYHFNFSDQHMLNQSLAAGRVSSYMAFDSRVITSLLAVAQKAGLLALLKKVSPKILYGIISSSVIGTARYGLQVEAEGTNGKKAVMTALGQVEAVATAAVTVYIGRLLYAQKVKPGVHPIEQAVDADALYTYLKEKGIQIISN